MNSLFVCEASPEYIKYLDNNTLFKAPSGKMYLYNIKTNFYEKYDCDVIVRDSLGNQMPINIFDLQEFVDIFQNIIISNEASSSIIKSLINPTKDKISGNKK